MPIRRPWRHRAIESISLQFTDGSSPKMHTAHSSRFGGTSNKAAGGEMMRWLTPPNPSSLWSWLARCGSERLQRCVGSEFIRIESKS